MRQMILALAALLAIAVPAHAQQGRRIGFPPSYQAGLRLPHVAGLALTGDCAKTPPTGGSQAFCYDPANGSYTSDGVTPAASLGAAGATLNGTCAVTASSGLTCSGADIASVATTLPAASGAGYILVVNASTVANAAGTIASLGQTGTSFIADTTTTSGARQEVIQGSAGTATGSGGTVQVAICPTSASAALYSIGGAAAVALTGGTTPPANPTLYMASRSNGSSALGASGYMRSVRGILLTCNAANVQAASAN